jgi:hypothetical protein
MTFWLIIIILAVYLVSLWLAKLYGYRKGYADGKKFAREYFDVVIKDIYHRIGSGDTGFRVLNEKADWKITRPDS